MADSRLLDDVVCADRYGLEGTGGDCMPHRVKVGALHRSLEFLPRFPAKALTVAAVSVLIGLTAACGTPEASEVTAIGTEYAPPPASALPPATTHAGGLSSEIGSSNAGSLPSSESGAGLEEETRTRSASGESAVTTLVDPSPSVSGVRLEEESEVSGRSAPTVVSSGGLSDGRGPAMLDRDEPLPQSGPQFLHADVDGDNAVIISGGEADTAQASRAQRSEDIQPGPTPSKGAMFTWHDGDRLASVWQDTRLVVSDVITEGGWDDPSGPVFWSESDRLMALPGGVVLILDPTWGTAAVNAFMRSNNIDPSDAEAFEGLPNWFIVETAPGFPSLRLANALAGQGGVIISSPNWWIEGLIG